MNPNEYLNKIINEFETWWQKDPHSTNMSFYDNIITKEHFESMKDSEFVNFFYEFAECGGKIQSGGDRTKNQFRETILNNLDKFKVFVSSPFDSIFSLENWFTDLNDFPGFGIGIATIYLNRIDRTKYPIMNNKTLKALRYLGFKISSSKNWNNYKLVKKYQDELIRNNPLLENYYKADSLNHFLITIKAGKDLILNYQDVIAFEQQMIQIEVEQSANELKRINRKDLLEKINTWEIDKPEEIETQIKAYKRNAYLMAMIKKYRKYTCQFCETKIPRSNGDFYIEACHIKPKCEGGQDSLNNILVLCPNCHKLFDYNDRKNEVFKENTYFVTIRNKRYSVPLK